MRHLKKNPFYIAIMSILFSCGNNTGMRSKQADSLEARYRKMVGDNNEYVGA